MVSYFIMSGRSLVTIAAVQTVAIMARRPD
jgi:hypothetical protein